MNCWKIVANGMVAFFTTLGGLLSIDIFIEALPPSSLVIGALVGGGIQAGLAMARELQTEVNNNSAQNTTGKKGFCGYGKKTSKLDYLVFY